MKVVWTQIFSLFIIFILLASAAAVFAPWGKSKNKTLPTTETNTPIIKAIYSGDVNGIVKEKTDEIILMADTNELDITKLDSKIKDLKDTKYIKNSQYTTDQNRITYVANIKLKNKDYNWEFVEGLNKIFLSYKIYLTQVFTFTNPVHLVNTDKNTSIDYNFGYNEIKVLTESTTRQNDNILVRFDVLMANETPIQIFAYEITNISAQPIYFTNEIDANIFDLSTEITLYSDSNFNSSVLATYFSDYNYEPIQDGNITHHKIITKDGVEAVSNFIKDFNTFTGSKTGKIYVSDLNYENKIYVYDKNIEVYVDYNTLGKEVFTIGAYLYRGELAQVFAYQKK